MARREGERAFIWETCPRCGWVRQEYKYPKLTPKTERHWRKVGCPRCFTPEERRAKVADEMAEMAE